MLGISRRGTAFLEFYSVVRDDIFAFCRALRFEPTEQQAMILKHVQGITEANVVDRNKRFIAVKSGQGPGKTTIAAVIALFRAFRNHRSQTYITAPTMRQIKDSFMKEVRQRLKEAHDDVQRFFTCYATSVDIMGDRDWGLRTATATREENIQGTHNPYLTFIFDEASGVDRLLATAVIGTMTNDDPLVLAIGNPNARDSFFFDCFNRDRNSWSTYTLNALESPIVDKGSCERMRLLYGENSDVYRVRVLGEFPLQDPTCVMNSDDLEACAKYPVFEAAKASFIKQFGIDLAQFGDDDSVIYRRSGSAIVEQKIFSKAMVDRVIGSAFEMQRIAGWRDQDCRYVVDTGGLGDGAIHHFYNNGKQVFPFRFDGTATQSRQFHDKITEAFFQLAELTRTRKISIPDDPQLIAELSSRQYNMTLTGRLKVESKREYKKRVQNGSPDRADAAVMAFYDAHEVKARIAPLVMAGGDRDAMRR